MNKDEIQETKALIKLKCIKKIIDILFEINKSENERDIKQYDIVLDYHKDNLKDFTVFKVKVISEGINDKNMRFDNVLFDFNFKLKDEMTGFAILKNIREYFVKKSEFKYSLFQVNEIYNGKSNNNELKYFNHQIKTNRHIDLCSMIHSKKDEQKLEKLSHRIHENSKPFILEPNKVDSNKDEIQLIKANMKKELAFTVINMLNELAMADNEQASAYEMLLDYRKNSYYCEFSIKILKNNKTIPFNINFKLKDKKQGINILNEIVNYYIENYAIVFDAFNSGITTYGKRDYIIISQNNINLNYRIPEEYFDESLNIFKESLNKKKNVKKLTKAE